jgi:hypothetical protein
MTEAVASLEYLLGWLLRLNHRIPQEYAPMAERFPAAGPLSSGTRMTKAKPPRRAGPALDLSQAGEMTGNDLPAFPETKFLPENPECGSTAPVSSDLTAKLCNA